MKTLSLCMITRNEAAMLPRCLASVKGVADEIVLVDTGSTDDTVAIAESFGARVFQTPWQEDFSLARNASIGQATGDWLLVLDADELLLPKSDDPIRKCLEAPPGIGGYLLTLENRLDSGTHSLKLLRLFRNDPSIRFEGRIHEQIAGSIERAGYAIGESDARIIHDGYREEHLIRKDKRARNLRLLELALSEKPNDPYLTYQLGKTFRSLERREDAAATFRKAIELLRNDDRRSEFPFFPKLFVYLAATSEESDAENILNEGLLLLPEHPELLWNAGFQAREAGDSDSALRYFERCGNSEDVALRARAALGASEILLRRGDFRGAYEQAQRARISSPEAIEPQLKRATALLQLGDRQNAREAYEWIVAHEPGHFLALLSLGTMYFEQGDFRKSLESLLAAEALRPELPDIPMLIRECKRLLSEA